MKVRRIKTVIFLATFIFCIEFPSALGAYSDPCKSNPCGEGAECQRRSNLAVCICPGDTSGDPFVSCKPPSSTTSQSNAGSSTTSYTSSSMAPQYTSSMSSSDDRSATYSTHPSSISTTHAETSTRFSNFDRYGTATRTSPSTTYYTKSTASYVPSTATETYQRTYGDTDSQPVNRGSQNQYDSSTGRNDYQDRRNQDSSTSSTFIHREGNSDYSNQRRHEDDGFSHRNNGNMNNRNDYSSTYSRNDQGNGNREYSTSSTINRHDQFADNRRPEYSDVNRRHDYGDMNSRNGNSDQYATRRIMYEGQYSTRQDENDHINSYNRYDDDRRGSYSSGSHSSSNNNRNSMEPSSSYNRDRYHGSSSSGPAFDRSSNSNVRDPLGVYKNCIEVNKVVVCADDSASTSNDYGSNGNSYKTNYESSSTRTVPSNYGNYRDSHEMSSRPTGSSHYKSFEDNSNFSRRQGGGSNVYQELVVSTTHDKPHKNSNNPRDEVRNGNLTPQPGDPDKCKKYCGVNAVCRQLLGRPICGCPEGYTGDASVRCYPEEDQMRVKNRCQKHTECADNQICEDSQCIDPCAKSSSSDGHFRMKRLNHFDDPSISRRRNEHESHTRVSVSRSENRNGMCGSNTQCQVLGHTPLCRCKDGYTGNPYSGCVPSKK